MNCDKTGFHAHLVPHNLYIYGDAYSIYEVLILRICEVSREPLYRVKHYTINNWANWFDENRTSMAHNSTMLCAPTDYKSHGYDGVPL